MAEYAAAGPGQQARPAASAMKIVELDASGVMSAREALAAVLVDCVAGGASVSFMAPYRMADGIAYFSEIAKAAGRGDVVVLAAESGGRIVGTVQVGLDTPPNQPHRGEIKKLLVHRAARRGGVGEALMRAAEAAAMGRGRTLLVLDTASDSAARLYERLGWTRAGVIPNYALFPDGRPCATTFFWKALGAELP